MTLLRFKRGALMKNREFRPESGKKQRTTNHGAEGESTVGPRAGPTPAIPMGFFWIGNEDTGALPDPIFIPAGGPQTHDQLLWGARRGGNDPPTAACKEKTWPIGSITESSRFGMKSSGQV